ncbi:MAG: hypothetical protein ACKO96_35045 [Flammeovirgaceae bacterium]
MPATEKELEEVNAPVPEWVTLLKTMLLPEMVVGRFPAKATEDDAPEVKLPLLIAKLGSISCKPLSIIKLQLLSFHYL